ncbi:MAG: Uncharacterized protein G01um10147_378 [Microgenomates group bacterium Gr01-1014_7]|nr:MAG: Uncharacterized protein G01um10147_378 [Microgenomates group bacterium Gr01-1014_7]
MAKIFLDANIFIDAIHRAPEKHILEDLEGNVIYVSPLSFHIYCYTFKIKIPNKKVYEQRDKFQLAGLSETILNQALLGPTSDLEDNIQLHSAIDAECDLFLTQDDKLLDLIFFGKMRIHRTIDML